MSRLSQPGGAAVRPRPPKTRQRADPRSGSRQTSSRFRESAYLPPPPKKALAMGTEMPTAHRFLSSLWPRPRALLTAGGRGAGQDPYPGAKSL